MNPSTPSLTTSPQQGVVTTGQSMRHGFQLRDGKAIGKRRQQQKDRPDDTSLLLIPGGPSGNVMYEARKQSPLCEIPIGPNDIIIEFSPPLFAPPASKLLNPLADVDLAEPEHLLRDHGPRDH